jgi:hypothetical protein
MIERGPRYQEFQQAACLMPGDPDRLRFESEIQTMNLVERIHWMRELGETDRLRGELDRVQIPSQLVQNLLRIARETSTVDLSPAALKPVVPTWRAALNRPMGRLIAAAVALIGIGLLAYNLWPASEPAGRALLNDKLAGGIAKQAVQLQEAAAPMEFALTDPRKLSDALSSHQFSFPIMMLNPTAKVDFRGGGVCDFEGTPAVYTRWQGKGVNYTVYQFDGKKLGIPASFLTTDQIPRELWHGNSHYRVVIWPGPAGQCTWAVAMDSDTADDVFSGSYPMQ